MTTIKDLIEYLQGLPQDAEVVTTNSYAWFSHDVKGVSEQDIKRYIYLKDKPTRNGKEIHRPCLVIHDDKKTDY